MRRKKIDRTLKSRIISESLKPGIVISELAKKYAVSKDTIYSWRSAYNKSKNSYDLQKLDDSNNKFVEVSVSETSGPVLQEVSLKFAEFSVALQGKIKSSTLLSIVKILEKEC